MSAEPREGYLALARITRPHGTRGEVRVTSFNPEAPNLKAGRRVAVGKRDLLIREIRPTPQGWIVAFGGITNRDEAEALQGRLLETPEATVRPDEGAYFVHQLVGLDVFLQDGTLLGTLTDVLQPGANDVYVVTGERGEALIPAIADVITEIDVVNGRMVITPLPGLLNETL